jgi:hypothetical protein
VPPEQDVSVAPSAPRLTGRIELRNVTFKYGPRDPDVLNGVNLWVEAGQTSPSSARPAQGRAHWQNCWWVCISPRAARFSMTEFPCTI